MSRDWTFYLEDILDSASKVLAYTQGMTLESFCNNDLVFDAVVRNLEIIGEAAKHLPDEAKAAMPDIEWSKAAAFRDVIAHDYFGLNVDIIWDVVESKIPEIVRLADALLKRVRNEAP
jgi:uncharacterized protein with HEPN domain